VQSRSPCSPTKGRFQNENARKQRTIRHLEFDYSGYEPEGREFESPGGTTRTRSGYVLRLFEANVVMLENH